MYFVLSPVPLSFSLSSGCLLLPPLAPAIWLISLALLFSIQPLQYLSFSSWVTTHQILLFTSVPSSFYLVLPCWFPTCIFCSFCCIFIQILPHLLNSSVICICSVHSQIITHKQPFFFNKQVASEHTWLLFTLFIVFLFKIYAMQSEFTQPFFPMTNGIKSKSSPALRIRSDGHKIKWGENVKVLINETT